MLKVFVGHAVSTHIVICHSFSNKVFSDIETSTYVDMVPFKKQRRTRLQIFVE